MNYYGPLQKMTGDGQPSGLFHYCVQNDRANGMASPIGNCAQSETCPECKGTSNPTSGQMMAEYHGMERVTDCAKCGNKGRVAVENACPGHATADEAIAHQREYELDHAKFKPVPLDEFRRDPCKVCGAATSSFAEAGPGMKRSYPLCDAHLNREGLDQVLSVGTAWSSY